MLWPQYCPGATVQQALSEFPNLRSGQLRYESINARIFRVQPILRIATQAVRAAGRELMARAPSAPSSRSISAASEAYFQRTHDRALRTIASTIQRSYPEHEVVSSDDFLGQANAETSWIVEPICGRMNFMRRLDHFCTLVGISRADRLQHALIVDHFRDGHFHVTRREGCFTNDGRMRVSDTRTTSGAFVALNGPDAIAEHSNLRLTTRVSGCLGLDIANTACGRFDALTCESASVFHFQFARLFIREAGGFASTLNGGEWSSLDDGLIAGNTYLHRKLVAERVKRESVAAV